MHNFFCFLPLLKILRFNWTLIKNVGMWNQDKRQTRCCHIWGPIIIFPAAPSPLFVDQNRLNFNQKLRFGFYFWGKTCFTCTGLGTRHCISAPLTRNTLNQITACSTTNAKSIKKSHVVEINYWPNNREYPRPISCPCYVGL